MRYYKIKRTRKDGKHVGEEVVKSVKFHEGHVDENSTFTNRQVLLLRSKNL